MLFVDFDKLKIIKEYTFDTQEWDVQIPDLSLRTIQTHGLKWCSEAFAATRDSNELPIHYVINIDTPATLDAEEFLCLTSSFIAYFFKGFCLDKGRKREHRLGVPKPLCAVNCNHFVLKQPINSLTIRDKMNLTIKCQDFTFMLVDTKEVEDTNEFIHDIDELEGDPEDVIKA